MSCTHLGIRGVDPVAVEPVPEERASASGSLVISSAVDAVGVVGAGQAARRHRDGRVSLWFCLAARSCATVIVLSVRASALSTNRMVRTAGGGGVAPAHATRAEGDAWVGTCRSDANDAVTEHELVLDQL